MIIGKSEGGLNSSHNCAPPKLSLQLSGPHWSLCPLVSMQNYAKASGYCRVAKLVWGSDQFTSGELLGLITHPKTSLATSTKMVQAYKNALQQNLIKNIHIIHQAKKRKPY